MSVHSDRHNRVFLAILTFVSQFSELQDINCEKEVRKEKSELTKAKGQKCDKTTTRKKFLKIIYCYSVFYFFAVAIYKVRI